MPIQLDKILADIAVEKVLHPNYPDATKKEMDDAWVRVGKSNKLSVHEARSIFKVLQKKYDQEKSKGSTAWKLFNIMEEIHSKKVEVKTATVKQEEELEVPMEEDEEYEMLEVQEEEDHAQQTPLPPRSTGSTSDGESPTKSNSPSESPEKEEKPPIKRMSAKSAAISNISSAAKAAAAKTPPPSDEKKLLNNLVCTRQLQTHTAAAAALNKKGITLKKTTNTTPLSSTRASNANAQAKNSTPQRGALDIGKTIQLPESIKRKLSEERSPTSAAGATTPTQPQIKKLNVGQTIAQQNKSERGESHENHATTTTPSSSTTAAESASVHGINLITIPANLPNGLVTGGRGGGASSSTAATVASTTASTNGFSPRIEDIDFRNDIIFDAGQNGSVVAAQKSGVTTSDIVNVGNFDNALPPTFFKNLCNSSRYEALGLYVANVMNRLRPRSAAKLEHGILRAITDVQSEELE